MLANGRLTAMTYPDGTVVDYVRDSLGRTTGIGVTPAGGTRQTLLGSALYHPFGPVAQWTYGNTRVMTRTLNQNGQPGVVQDTAVGGLSVGYEFDEVGNLKTLRNGDQTDPPLRRYGYDALNRLTDSRDGSTNAVLQAYAYDATGNRTGRTLGTTTEASTYTTTSHRLQSVAGIPRGYDDSGNTTSINGMTKTFEYNQAGRLSVVKANGAQTASYLYNGSGERVRRIAGGQTTLTLYGDAGQWLGDYDATGQPLQQAIWFNDLPVGLLTGTGANLKLHYIEADALGTPRVVIDPTRNVAVWRWGLDGEAFGDSAPDQDPDSDGIAFVSDMRFPGQRYDSASGLSYNYYRDFDPGVGRYVQSDPIGFNGGISTYGYATANPLVRADNFGLADRPGAGWFVMGVHTNVDEGRTLSSGHAWTTLRPVGSTLSHSYSVWPDGHVPAGGGGPIPDNGALSDLRRDMEATHGYPFATQSVFFLLSPEQKRRLDRYMSGDFEYDTGGGNCADFTHGALLAATGIDLNISDVSSFWTSTPSQLSRRIDALNTFADIEIAGGVRAVSRAAQRRIVQALGGS